MTMVMAVKKIIIFLCFCVLSFVSYAGDLTVIYTGNSHSSLYPCGHCPASVGGGVTRRATVINDVKAKSKNTIIIDAGEFTAGGSFDEASINPETDKNRTAYFCKALKAMGYDVIGIGENDFNFGSDFLKENIRKNALNAVSANLKLEGVSPYYIKKFPGFNVGIIGLSPQSISQKNPVEVSDYKTSLKNTIKLIKPKADFIILVSSLGDATNKEIAESFNDIGLILSSGNILDSKEYEKINEVIVMKPSYLAKDLRIADMEIKGGRISSFNLKKEKLPLTVKENSEIKKLVPACFKDSDCQKREGLSPSCQNEGLDTAACVYFEPKRIEALLITDTQCPFCVTAITQKLLKDAFTGINFTVIDYKDRQAKELINKYDLRSLPAFILPEEVKKEKEFSKIEKYADERGGKLILKPDLSGVFLLLNRKETPRKIDYFINLYEPETLTMLSDMVSFCAKEKIKLDIHFIVKAENTYGYPREEVRTALAVKKAAPEKFYEYLATRLTDIRKTSAADSLGMLGIDYNKVNKIAKSKETEKLIANNDKLISELNVNYGNVILVNNNKIFAILKIKPGDLEKLFRR